MKNEMCFFTRNKPATNDVDYVGYYGSDPHTKAYRGIIGLSIANFDVVEEHVFLPRSNYAKYVHISSVFIKLITFAFLFYFIDFHLFWRLVFSFLGSVILDVIYHFILRTFPKNLYLFNLSSVLDFVLFIFLPLLSTLFFPGLIEWMSIGAFFLLLFFNGFTWKLKKYHLYPYPEKLYSMYEVGFKHGLHPQIDNYLGFIAKPLRWFFSGVQQQY